MIGFWTLLYKELLRFWKVAFQTVGAPVLTALLYLMIFGHVLDEHVQVHGVRYTSFLVPGLVMMQVLQNAFAHSAGVPAGKLNKITSSSEVRTASAKTFRSN